MDNNRREFLSRAAPAALGAVAAGAVVSCTTTGGVDMEAIAKAIKQVQDGVAQACKTFGDLVPEADSVWLLLASLMKVSPTNPVMVAVTAVEQAIKLITDTACPANPTARPATAPGASVNVNGVDVHFIPLKK